MLHDPNLIVGMQSVDDAGVYKLSDDLAIIQTIDFFTPIVDDPFVFGQIAAANALSDVYAMGGKPLTAMNVVCFPARTMDIEILKEILKGGQDKMIEAEATLVGGHSVEDNEIKYGLSVTGIIHPDKVLTNIGAKLGDSLILTKPLGTGIINTAIKRGVADNELISRVSESMARLNKSASDAAQEIGVNACTDVTGFGLMGHALEMLQDNKTGIVIYSSQIPFFPEAEELAINGMVPGGANKNREYCLKSVEIDHGISTHIQDILFDPQTSGGLLISVSKDRVQKLLDLLREKSIENASIIGEVTASPKGKILVK